MKRILILLPAALALVLVAPGGDRSAGQVHKGGAFHPGTTVVRPAPKSTVVVKPGPTIVTHTPSLGGTHVAAPKIVVQQPKTVVQKNVFINENKNKFIGIGQKHPGTVTVVKTPPVVERVTDKGRAAIVGAYHTHLGGKGIVVGGKAVNLNTRRQEFVNAYEKNWRERIDHRYERAFTVRHDLGTRYHTLFTREWYDRHPLGRIGWWGRYPDFARGWYTHFGPAARWWWWRPMTWVALTGWWAPNVWAPPLYYDYGGNVIFENNVVYVEGQPVATTQDYYLQAQQLAEAGETLLESTPPDPNRLETDWMPLGSFAVSNESDGEPTTFLQLAVNKQGVIAGSYFNAVTDETLPVTGSIDPRTQRAAWFVGDNRKTVFETGAYNLTSSETQVLVHFGPDQTQSWLLVRMEQPKE